MPSVVGHARPLRWLVVAPLSAEPSGRVVAASGERFARIMAKIGPAVQAEIPDGLGQDANLSVSLAFERPRDFRLAEVIKRVPMLEQLTTIADGITRRGAVKGAESEIRKAVGDGELLRAVTALSETAEAPAKAPAAAQAPDKPAAPSPAPEPKPSGGSALDAIFSKAAVSPPPEADASAAAKSGLDAFVGAMRKGDASTTRRASRTEKSRATDVATLIRDAVRATALDLMASPSFAQIEASWRGFRTVVAAAPGADDLAIDLIDSDHADVVSRIGARLDVPPMDRPDAVFVACPVGDVATLAQLAALAEQRSVPIAVEVPEATAGARIDDDPDLPEVPDAWSELRSSSSAAWLCACANRIVVANEEVGPTHRIVFASPVWGVAAMLSASVGQTAGPGQIFGRAGALVGPASYGLDADGSETIATERLATIDRQRALASRGVLALGSERGSDRLRLAAAPMVSGGRTEDAPLPGRILAGRAARFTQAVRDELPPHATQQEIAARLTEAATNFLPRSPAGAVALEVRTDPDGKLGVDGSIGASLAGASFSFSSDL